MTTPRVALLLLAVAALGFAPAARAPRRARAAPPAAKPKTFEQWQRHRAGQERSAAAKEIGLDSLVRGFAGLVGVDPGVLAKRYAPAPEDGSGRGGALAAAQTPARRPERRRSSIDFPDDDPFMSPDCLRMGD